MSQCAWRAPRGAFAGASVGAPACLQVGPKWALTVCLAAAAHQNHAYFCSDPVNSPRKSDLSSACRRPCEEVEAPRPERGLQLVSGKKAHDPSGESLGVERCDLWVPMLAFSWRVNTGRIPCPQKYLETAGGPHKDSALWLPLGGDPFPRPCVLAGGGLREQGFPTCRWQPTWRPAQAHPRHEADLGVAQIARSCDQVGKLGRTHLANAQKALCPENGTCDACWHQLRGRGLGRAFWETHAWNFWDMLTVPGAKRRNVPESTRERALGRQRPRALSSGCPRAALRQASPALRG